ncbi:MAG: DinB family protein [Acidobacteria bacterium]|nr:DinB family protein [Acidobacteriota bacterium]
MNPYASHLGQRDPVEVIAATPGRVRELARTLGPDRAQQPPAPGKWSAREIVCHLADCEIVFAFRIRQALAEDRHTIQPFDQDRFARHYAACGFDSALAAFVAVRTWNQQLIGRLKAEELARPVTHPERGEMTLRTIIETMGGHDLNHLAQLEAIASKYAAA